jgi:hypothetical protein
LIDEDAPGALESIDDGLAVRRARWVGEQLDQLRAAANADDGSRIDAVIGERLKAALAADSDTALRGLLDVFGWHDSATTARIALLSRLESENLLESEVLLRQIERAASPAEVVSSTARLAQVLADAGRADLAAVYYGKLKGDLGDVIGPDGKTGKQVVAELTPTNPVQKWLTADASWPSGAVTGRETSKPPTADMNRGQQVVDLEVPGAAGPFFRDLTVSLDLRTQILLGRDGLGNSRFRIPILEQRARDLSARRFNVYAAPPVSQVSIHGGLLVLSMSDQVIAIDTMRAGGRSTNNVLWTHDLADQIGGYRTSQGVYSRPIQVAWGGTRYVPEDTYTRRYGGIGPLGDQGVYFQRLRDLYCVDPLTGQTQWRRKNVGLGNQLFGDDELLFVAPPGEGETLVLRASTGEKLGTRRIVPFEQRMLAIGRFVLSWEAEAGRPTLAMRDPWEEKELWSHTFAAGAKAAMVAEEVVGVLMPDGEFSLLRLPDGKQLVKEKLEPETSLINIHLLASGDQYLLVTNSSARLEGPGKSRTIAGAANYPMVNGRVYAFDRLSRSTGW